MSIFRAFCFAHKLKIIFAFASIRFQFNLTFTKHTTIDILHISRQTGIWSRIYNKVDCEVPAISLASTLLSLRKLGTYATNSLSHTSYPRSKKVSIFFISKLQETKEIKQPQG